jgi:16S rRNA processing protein RimM
VTEKFIIGLVGAPFGVKGMVKVHPCSGEIGHLLELESVIVSKDGKERLLKIEESAPLAKHAIATPSVIMRFSGIDSPEAAKTLNGAQLLAGREQASPLQDGEFYIEDLKGLEIISENGETIGQITDIIEGGGGELAEIRLNSGEMRLVPFRSEFFPEISPGKGKVTLQNLWILE